MTDSFSADDRRFMSRALELARFGLYTTDPNPRVGCVLVANGQIIGEGYHRRAGLPHAEIEALQACQSDPRGATAYVTLEPCSHFGRTPPCCDALIKAGVARVVAAATDPNSQVAGRGLAIMREAGIEVVSGLMAEDCEALNPGYLSRMRRGRPWLRVKLAASLDGRTALANGESQWITSAEARHDVQHLRARASAILTGSATVLADDPQMTVRLSAEHYGPEWPIRQPLLAIIDSKAQTPVQARLFERDGAVIVYTEAPAAALDSEVDSSCCYPHGAGIDPLKVLQDLAARGCNEVHVEAGARLAGVLLEAQLIDEIVTYIAPVLLGADARELIAISGIDNMAQRPELCFTDVTPVGRDLRLTLTPQYAARNPSCPQ